MSQDENPEELNRLADALPPILRRRHVAEVLRVHPRTIDRYRREGRLDGITTATGQHGYTRAEVLRFLGYRGPIALVLLLLLGYLALRAACAAGFEPATDALRFLQLGREPSCAKHHHRGRVFALAARPPASMRFARLRIPGRRGRGRQRQHESDPAALNPSLAATPPANRSRAPPVERV